MTITNYDTNILEIYNSIKDSKPFFNNMATLITDTTGLIDSASGLIANMMDTYVSNGGSIGDPTWLTLDRVLQILDAPYLGSGSYAQPTVFDKMYPPLKSLLASKGDLSAVVAGFGIPLKSILEHTNSVTESLPNILSAIGVKNNFNMAYFNAIETCSEYFNIMGLLLGEGKKLLDAANEIIQKIIQLALLGLAVFLAGIALLLKPLAEVIKTLYEKLIKENKALQDLYKFLNDYALAALLAATRDPCVKAIIDSVASEKLRKAFYNVRKLNTIEDVIKL